MGEYRSYLLDGNESCAICCTRSRCALIADSNFIQKKARTELLQSGLWEWWRRRESNPRPQVLHYKTYMLSHVFVSHRALPNGQGRREASSGVV